MDRGCPSAIFVGGKIQIEEILGGFFIAVRAGRPGNAGHGAAPRQRARVACLLKAGLGQIEPTDVDTPTDQARQRENRRGDDGKDIASLVMCQPGHKPVRPIDLLAHLSAITHVAPNTPHVRAGQFCSPMQALWLECV